MYKVKKLYKCKKCTHLLRSQEKIPHNSTLKKNHYYYVVLISFQLFLHILKNLIEMRCINLCEFCLLI